MVKEEDKQINIGVLSIREDQWDSFLEVIDDREQEPDTWLEWRTRVDIWKKEMELKGMDVQEIEFELEALVQFCKDRGMRINGGSRAEYTTELMKRIDGT